MKALLLVAHGSRRSQSNDEVVVLADRLKDHCSDQYKIIHSAFLELTDPQIPAGIQQCIDDGATSVIVLPYFLNSGRHVTEDIPSIVNTKALEHPQIDISIASHVGGSDLMMELLITSANGAVNG